MKKVLFYLFTLLISTNIVFAEHLDNEMNVMSFNIRMSTKSDGANWWEYRKDLAANVIKFYDVDMFGAQEVLHNQLTDLLDRLPDYGYVGVGREDGKTKGEYSPILYRKDRFSVVKSGNFWLAEDIRLRGPRSSLLPWAKKAGMPLVSVLRLGRYSKIRNPEKSFSF